MNWLVTSLFYSVTYLFANVSSCGDDLNEREDLARLAALKTEVLLLVGKADCSDIGECRSLPLGAKPCGGPWEYLIYSIIDSDTLKIKEKVKEHNEWNRVLNSRYGL